MAKTEKTALEKSHSKSSNAKLTLLCLLAAVAFAALFASLMLIPKLPTYLSIILIAASAIILVLCVLLLKAFKR